VHLKENEGSRIQISIDFVIFPLASILGEKCENVHAYCAIFLALHLMESCFQNWGLWDRWSNEWNEV